ncbi:MAG: hypothetical protein KAW66_11475 [Candidatus Lokiarchaeota archaeon]|nr:hypothetical protein [Candidatus Lokiarchaeota archaeon]
MEENSLRHEKNIAKILDRVISLCKQSNLTDLAKKGEQVLKTYENAKNFR